MSAASSTAMPEPIWLTKQQVLSRTGWSEATFWRRQGELVSRGSEETGANGRQVREYLASSVPAGKAEDQSSAPKLEILPARSSFGPLFEGQKSTALQPQRVTLTDPKDEALAKQNYAIIEPILNFQADRYSFLCLADGHSVTSVSRMMDYQAECSGKGRSTIKRLIKRYRDYGWAGLAHKERVDKNTSWWFEEHPDAAYAAAYLYLDCRQSPTAIHEMLCESPETFGISSDDLPSRETVRRWLSFVPPYLKSYALKGRKAYRDVMSPYLSRDYTQTDANEIWVIDHMICDVECWNDCFPEAPWGAPIRLRLTTLLDFRSRLAAGWAFAWEGSSRSIATALYNAVVKFEAAKEIYSDNGKDMRKAAKGAMPAYLQDPAEILGWQERELKQLDKIGVIARLGTKIRFCLPYWAQSKPVERYHRTYHEDFDKLHSGYLGKDSAHRPDAATAEMTQHRKALKNGQLDESLHPRASEYIRRANIWIEQEYNNKSHSGQGMDESSPREVYEANLRPDPTRKQHTEADLAMLLGNFKTIKVARAEVSLTAIPGLKRTYTYHDAVSRDILHDLNGTEVMVAYDPHISDRVAILDLDGHYLCSATEKSLIGMGNTPEIGERISNSMADRHHLEKRTRQQMESIARGARSAGAVTPIEAFDRRHNLNLRQPEDITGYLTHKPTNPEIDTPAKPMTPAELARTILGGKR